MAGASQIAEIDLRHLAPKFDQELLSQYDVGDAVIAEITREYVIGVFDTFNNEGGDTDPREEVYTGKIVHEPFITGN